MYLPILFFPLPGRFVVSVSCCDLGSKGIATVIITYVSFFFILFRTVFHNSPSSFSSPFVHHCTHLPPMITLVLCRIKRTKYNWFWLHILQNFMEQCLTESSIFNLRFIRYKPRPWQDLEEISLALTTLIHYVAWGTKQIGSIRRFSQALWFHAYANP